MLYTTVTLSESQRRIRLESSSCGKRNGIASEDKITDLFRQIREWRSWKLEASMVSPPPRCIAHFQECKISIDIDVTRGGAYSFVYALDDLVKEVFGDKCSLEAVQYLEEG